MDKSGCEMYACAWCSKANAIHSLNSNRGLSTATINGVRPDRAESDFCCASAPFFSAQRHCLNSRSPSRGLRCVALATSFPQQSRIYETSVTVWTGAVGHWTPRAVCGSGKYEDEAIRTAARKSPTNTLAQSYTRWRLLKQLPVYRAYSFGQNWRSSV